jgi:hypothetical protein
MISHQQCQFDPEELIEFMRESVDELWPSVSDNHSGCPMVFPDFFQEEESCAFSIDGGMHQDEVCVLR